MTASSRVSGQPYVDVLPPTPAGRGPGNAPLQASCATLSGLFVASTSPKASPSQVPL